MKKGNSIILFSAVMTISISQVFAQTAHLKLGFVDYGKLRQNILDQEWKIHDEAKKQQDIVSVLDKQYKEIQATNKSVADLDRLQKRLKNEKEKLNSMKENHWDIESRVNTAIKAEAVNKNVDIVCDKYSVLYCGTELVDLTNGTRKRLTSTPIPLSKESTDSINQEFAQTAHPNIGYVDSCRVMDSYPGVEQGNKFKQAEDIHNLGEALIWQARMMYLIGRLESGIKKAIIAEAIDRNIDIVLKDTDVFNKSAALDGPDLTEFVIKRESTDTPIATSKH